MQHFFYTVDGVVTCGIFVVEAIINYCEKTNADQSYKKNVAYETNFV